MNQTRIERVLSAMAAEGLPQLIVTDPLSIRYLTGADIFPGERMLALLLREDGEHTFFVNILFPEPACGLPVVRFSDTDDGPALIADKLIPGEPVGVDKTWPARFLLRLMEVRPGDYRNGKECGSARLSMTPAWRSLSRRCIRVQPKKNWRKRLYRSMHGMAVKASALHRLSDSAKMRLTPTTATTAPDWKKECACCWTSAGFTTAIAQT